MWGSINRQMLGDMAFMAQTLSLDFIGLDKETAASRVPGVWHGSEIAKREDAILVVHPSFPDFNYHLVFNQPEARIVEGVVVQGINEMKGLWLFASAGIASSKLRPDPTGKLGSQARKAAKILENNFQVMLQKS